MNYKDLFNQTNIIIFEDSQLIKIKVGGKSLEKAKNFANEFLKLQGNQQYLINQRGAKEKELPEQITSSKAAEIAAAGFASKYLGLDGLEPDFRIFSRSENKWEKNLGWDADLIHKNYNIHCKSQKPRAPYPESYIFNTSKNKTAYKGNISSKEIINDAFSGELPFGRDPLFNTGTYKDIICLILIGPEKNTFRIRGFIGWNIINYYKLDVFEIMVKEEFKRTKLALCKNGLVKIAKNLNSLITTYT